MRFLFTLLFLTGVLLESQAQFKYINPLPGSQYKNPQTTIILKNGNYIDKQSVKRKNLVEIYGSKSGNHSWTSRLSDDNKTVMIKPDEIFECSELVTVKVNSELRTSQGAKIEGTEFTFKIRDAISPELEEHRRVERLHDFIDCFGYDPTKKSGTIRDYPLDSMPTFVINVNNNASPGKIFYANQYDFDIHDTNSFPTIIENDGTIYWAKDLGEEGHDFKINHSGYLSYYEYLQYQWIIMDSTFTPIDSVTCKNGYEPETNGHEFLMFPNGHMYVIAFNKQVIDMTQYGGLPDADVKGLIIQELDASKDVIFEWASWDHFEIDDAMPSVPLTTGDVDYCHGNSVEVDTDGNLLVSCRNMSELCKINHETGDLMWRMGGENNQFTFFDDVIPQHFDYQHDFRRLPNGNVSVFNNCNNCLVTRSQAKEYKLDEVNKTATLVWYYEHPDVGNNEVYGRASGSAQKLPDGHWMINWGLIYFNKGIPSMTEVDSLGNIVWEMTFDSAGQKSYRAHKYVWEPCGLPADSTFIVDYLSDDSVAISWTAPHGASSYDFLYKLDTAQSWNSIPLVTNSVTLAGLIPASVYEWSLKTYCESFNGDSSGYSNAYQFATIGPSGGMQSVEVEIFDLYPNPANDEVTLMLHGIGSHQPVFLRILNSLGEVVKSKSVSGNIVANAIIVDLQSLEKGAYVVEMTSGNQTARKKLIVQ